MVWIKEGGWVTKARAAPAARTVMSEAFAVQCFDNILRRLNNSPKANSFSVNDGDGRKTCLACLGKSRPGSVSEGRFRIEHATESLVVLVFSFAGFLRILDHPERFPEE